ncbi:MAG: hypothetical protein K2H70_00930 [Bacteroidales bacterium]|nr:hypothetical protein [Bacteroidales bacterium]
MIKDIFQELIETLSGIKELCYVASDWGQLDYEQPPVQWPCALIDMPGLQCGELSGGSLMATGTVTVQLVDRPPQHTSARAPKAQQDAGLILFDLIDRVYESLHAVDSESHTPFVLKSIERVNLIDLQSYTMTFAVGFKQHKPGTMTAIQAEPMLKPQIKPLSQASVSYGQKKTATSI